MPGAIFLDRDGVINYNRDDYVKRPEEFVFLPGSAAAAARLTRAGREIFIVSNQAAVARGLMTHAALAAVSEKMLSGLEEAGARVRGVYYCPHRPEDACDCRKPAPGLLLRAAHEHGVDLASAIVIGDQALDLHAAAAVGAQGILVLSGKTSRAEVDRLPLPPLYVAADLWAAVDWILDSNA